MAVIRGLFETHLAVRDIERSAEFYEKVLGLELAFAEVERKRRYYWLGQRRHMLIIRQVEPSLVLRDHFAMEIDLADMYGAADYLRARGLDPRNFFDGDADELIVFPWLPAVSIYFRDPDGHSLEFLARLPDPPRPELGLVTWQEWEALHDRTLRREAGQ
jgi:lactoylglutathione lyase